MIVIPTTAVCPNYFSFAPVNAYLLFTLLQSKLKTVINKKYDLEGLLLFICSDTSSVLNASDIKSGISESLR